LESRCLLTHDTVLLTFKLPDSSKPLGLSTCACILCKFDDSSSGEAVVRPYTPVSSNDMVGKFQLVIKVYREGKMSRYLNEAPLGSAVQFKHIKFNVKTQYPFAKKHITMLVGGTGITPMIQALHAILGTATDATKVTVIFGNKSQKDILCNDLLEAWSKNSAGRLEVVHVLSDAEKDALWAGPKGFITRDLIQKHSAPPSEDVLIMVCGPPAMYTSLCGPRDKPKELVGVLSDMGYTAEQVVKF